MTPKVFLIILLSISLGSVGQYFFKQGMVSAGKLELGFKVVTLLFTPLVFTGLVCYGLATLCWLVVLSQTSLSLAYPFISISYIVVVLMGQFIFKERVTWMSWLGVLIICAGVVLVGFGAQAGKAAAAAPATVVNS